MKMTLTSMFLLVLAAFAGINAYAAETQCDHDGVCPYVVVKKVKRAKPAPEPVIIAAEDICDRYLTPSQCGRKPPRKNLG